MWKVCPEEALNHRLRVNARPLRKKVPHCVPAKHCRIKNRANEMLQLNKHAMRKNMPLHATYLSVYACWCVDTSQKVCG